MEGERGPQPWKPTEVHHAATVLDILDRGFYQHFGRRSRRTPEMISLRKWANLKVLFLLSVILWLVGCGSVGSIQPLESGEPLMESANLRGKWVTTDANSQEEEYFQIDSATSDIYLVTSLKPNRSEERRVGKECRSRW